MYLKSELQLPLSINKRFMEFFLLLKEFNLKF